MRSYPTRWLLPTALWSLIAMSAVAQSVPSHDTEGTMLTAVPVSERQSVAAACDANLITAQLAGGQRVVSVRNKEQVSYARVQSIGLRDGDVVERVNGAPPRNAAAVSQAIRGLTPGRDLTLVIARGGERRTRVLRATGSEPAPSQAAEDDVPVIVIDEEAIENEWADRDPWMLLVMAAPRMAYDANGAIIGVTSGSFSGIPLAVNLGLRNGDIIQSVNGYAITSEQAIFDVVNALEGERHFTARLLREGKPLTLRYRLE